MEVKIHCKENKELSSGTIDLSFTASKGDEKKDRLAWNGIVKSILKQAFEGKNICIVTETPQETSYLHLISGHEVSFVENKIDFCVKTIKKCTTSDLFNIAKDEEFERGLLWICSLDNNDVQNETFQKKIINKYQETNDGIEMIYLDDDGDLLSWKGVERNLFQLRLDYISELLQHQK